MERRITSNENNDHNYISMVLKCTHLSVSQQDDLLELFAMYALLFDGTLGKISNVKVRLELKPNSKPYCVRAYKIPHHILEVACKEVEELCRIGVLQADIHSEWGGPCLFRAKKMVAFGCILFQETKPCTTQLYNHGEGTSLHY
jgi:hypothetical protein